MESAIVESGPVESTAEPTVADGTPTSTTTLVDSPAAGGPCPGDGTTAHRDIVYRAVDGVDPNFVSLDVYEPIRPADCPPAPVMIWVHGGGWRVGDKTYTMTDKSTWFNAAGWVLVSVNYRLSPFSLDLSDPDRVAYPVHEEDTAAAVAWVRDHASDYGADPGAISLMGHSAGASIVATLATDERFLASHGVDLGDLVCTVALDTAAYDVAWQAVDGPNPDLYLNAFGTDPAVWDDASPVTHVEAGKGIPRFLVVTRGSPARIGRADEFAQALRDAGVDTEVLVARGLDHAGVTLAVGAPDDGIVTPVLGDFLEGCLPGS